MLPRKHIRVQKEDIVLAAVKIVGKYGVQALTVSAIADTAGMSKTNFYRHFREKDEIYFALAEYIGGALMGKAAAIAEGGKEPLEKLEAIFFSHMTLVAEQPGIPRFVYSEDVHLGNRKLTETVAFLIGSYVKIVTGIIAAGIAAGELRKGISPRETALMFIGMIQFSALRWTIGGASYDVHDEAEKLWRNFSMLFFTRR